MKHPTRKGKTNPRACVVCGEIKVIVSWDRCQKCSDQAKIADPITNARRKETTRLWFESNADYRRAYKEANREHLNERANARRRERRIEDPEWNERVNAGRRVGRSWRKNKIPLYIEQEGICALGGEFMWFDTQNVTIDHKRPRHTYPAGTPKQIINCIHNLQVACGSHNSAKRDEYVVETTTGRI